MSDGYRIAWGAMMIIIVIIRLFTNPFLFIGESLVGYLEAQETTKGFLIWHNINGFLLGAVLILSGVLPEELIRQCWFPLLFIIFLSVIICNLKFVGTPWAYVPKTEKWNRRYNILEEGSEENTEENNEENNIKIGIDNENLCDTIEAIKQEKQ